MDLLFLGTSSGVPTLQRNVSALALIHEQGREWYLLDCGEATQHQLLRCPLSVIDLRAIFITHVHGDHCYGLPGLLASAAMNGRKTPLTLLAPRKVLEWVSATRELTQLWLPYELIEIAIDEQPQDRLWQDRGWNLSCVPLSHRVPSWAYVLQEDAPPQQLDSALLERLGLPRGPMWGQLQRGQSVQWQGQTIAAEQVLRASGPALKLVLGGDNDQPDLLAHACQGAQVLVHEATYTESIAQKVGPQVQHSSAARVGAFAASVNLPHLILTHFSPRYRPDGGDDSNSLPLLQAEAAQIYRGRLWLAQDFARFRLQRDGVLHAL
ncbi:ribonuclease Z [Massilia sp. W12]|uniref:ribonuclease Z n=1 Tax=Massilia sp. W12 TaxID=3126507 RepID=UPI0030D3E218